MENFMLFSKSAQLLDYATLLLTGITSNNYMHALHVHIRYACNI